MKVYNFLENRMLIVGRLLLDLRQHSHVVLTFKPAPVKSENEFLRCLGGVLESGISGPSIKNTSVSCSPKSTMKGCKQGGVCRGGGRQGVWQARALAVLVGQPYSCPLLQRCAEPCESVGASASQENTFLGSSRKTRD